MKFLLLLCLVVASGCYRTSLKSTAIGDGQKHDALGLSILSLSEVSHDASECPQGFAYVETQMGPGGALVWLITGGLIAPMSIEYACVSTMNGPGDALATDALISPSVPPRDRRECMEQARSSYSSCVSLVKMMNLGSAPRSRGAAGTVADCRDQYEVNKEGCDAHFPKAGP